MIRCNRSCGKVAPISEEELTGPSLEAHEDTENDPTLPVIVVPPEGWIGDPDAEGIVCGDCATTREIAEYQARSAYVEEVDPLELRGPAYDDDYDEREAAARARLDQELEAAERITEDGDLAGPGSTEQS